MQRQIFWLFLLSLLAACSGSGPLTLADGQSRSNGGASTPQDNSLIPSEGTPTPTPTPTIISCQSFLSATLDIASATQAPYHVGDDITWVVNFSDACADSFAVTRGQSASISAISPSYSYVTQYTVAGTVTEALSISSFKDGVQRGTLSLTKPIEILANTPSAPTIGTLTALPSSSSIIALNWIDTADNEVGFYVQRRVTVGVYETKATLPPNSTSYSDTGLTSNTLYEYQIIAFNDGGQGLSNLASATTPTEVPPVLPPLAPSSFAGSAGSSTQISLNWMDNSSNEDSFIIERSFCGGVYAVAGNFGANTTSFSDNGLVKNTCYSYRLRAHNIAGDSNPLVEVSVTTLDTVPEAPTQSLPTGVTAHAVVLHWQSNGTNHTSFSVERAISGGSFSVIANVGASVAQFLDDTVSPSTIYVYRIVAFNNMGVSLPSNIRTVTTLAVPIGVVVSVGVVSQASVSITPTQVTLDVNDYFAYDLQIFILKSDGTKTLLLNKPGPASRGGQSVFNPGVYTYTGNFSSALIGASSGTGSNRPQGYTVRTSNFAARSKDADNINISSGSNRNHLNNVVGVSGASLSFNVLDDDYGSHYYQVSACASGWNCYPLIY